MGFNDYFELTKKLDDTARPLGLCRSEMEIILLLGQKGKTPTTEIRGYMGNKKERAVGMYLGNLRNRDLIDRKNSLSSKGRSLYDSLNGVGEGGHEDS